MATLINLGSGAGSTNGDTLFQAFTKINTNYSDLESISNKSINVTTDGASDTKYPSVKAVKTYVDTNVSGLESISNKSINVTTDGASDTKYPSVKAVKTYVDANSSGVQVTKVVKTTITSAQILDLFTTPITVLDSSNPLTIKLPINIWVQRKPGNPYTLATASFLLVNDSGSNVSGNLNPNPLVGANIGFFTSYYNITQNGAGVDRNVLYKLKASTANPTDGTGDIDVYVTYIEITL